MAKKKYGPYNLDDFARDIAIEIVLGGSRLIPEDVASVLDGISPGDLKTFRERVEYHSVDFIPTYVGEGFRSYFSDELDYWFGLVRTEEAQEGVKKKVWIPSECRRNHRGKYFMLSDGRIERCEKATAHAMWPNESAGIDYNELPKEVAAKALCNILVKEFGNGGNEISFDRYVRVPVIADADADLWLASSIRLSKDGEPVFIFNGDSTHFEFSLEQMLVKDPDLLIDELSERLNCLRKEAFEEASKLSKLQDVFKVKANVLLDSFGYRTKLDFLYDELPIFIGNEGNSKRCYLRRDVDDLSPSARKFYLFSEDKFSDVNEFKPEELYFLVSSLDRTYDLLSIGREASRQANAQQCVELEVQNLSLPGVDTFTGYSLFVSRDGSLMVSGISDKSGNDVVYPVVSLSADSISRLGDVCTLAYNESLIANPYPKPDLKALKPKGVVVSSQNKLD